MLITTRQRHAPILRRSEIKHFLCIHRENRHRLPEQPESRDAAIGVHVKPNMRIRLPRRLSDLPPKPRRGSALLDPENRLPLPPPAGPGNDFLVGGGEYAFDGDLGRVVAGEEGGVDFDAGDCAGGDAETDDGPVEGGGVVAPRFPAVEPGAGVDHFAGFVDGGLGVEEVGGGGEVFIGAGEDFAAEGGGNEVWDVSFEQV
ncbi:hypothetical protein V499_04452 [Pseudogymnoascus sp. VKM F-103]|nr:hypothetical protein V499_04452 [Pseudogymnoascus sp. VKM F-103]